MKLEYKKNAKKLPNKLSDLLDTAVDDAIAAQKAGHTLRMGVWVRKNSGTTKCEVCLAGACMLKRLDLKKSDFVLIDPEYTDVSQKLFDIDALRSADYYTGNLEPLKAAAVDHANSIIAETYSDETGRADWNSYRQAAKILRAAGF